VHDDDPAPSPTTSPATSTSPVISPSPSPATPTSPELANSPRSTLELANSPRSAPAPATASERWSPSSTPSPWTCRLPIARTWRSPACKPSEAWCGRRRRSGRRESPNESDSIRGRSAAACGGYEAATKPAGTAPASPEPGDRHFRIRPAHGAALDNARDGRRHVRLDSSPCTAPWFGSCRRLAPDRARGLVASRTRIARRSSTARRFGFAVRRRCRAPRRPP
jgi:hypothetical protein